MGTTERRERERENLRRAILDAARDLFVAEGYEAVSLRKIADRIEYSATTIYLHFKDKDALLAALAEEGFTLLAERLEALAALPDPVERLRQGGRVYLDFAREQPYYYHLMFEIEAEMLAKSHDMPTSDTAGGRAFSFLAGCINKGLAQGRFRPSAPEPILSHTVWASLHGAAALLRAGRLGILTPDAQASFYESVVENTVRGLMSSPETVPSSPKPPRPEKEGKRRSGKKAKESRNPKMSDVQSKV